MVVKESVRISDLDHAMYLKHQWHEISSGRVEECAHMVKPANQFVCEGEAWRPNEYQGFAVVSMVDNNPMNLFLSFQLQEIQEELIAELDMKSYFLLPASSFHQTIANTLSKDRFKQFILDPGIEQHYPEWIENAFESITLPVDENPIKMKLIGLSVFHTAIGILGVIESEKDYTRIVSFRSQFYNDKQLASLHVRMTRPFIGHITLAYIEKELNTYEKDRLASAINKINEKLRRSEYYFLISNTELRRYHHLAEFKKENAYPTFTF